MEERQVEQPEPSLEDKAAHDFTSLIGEIKELAERMSLRQFKKVFLAVMEYPLCEEVPKFDDLLERQVFHACLHIQDTKFVLIKSVMEMKKDDLSKLLHGEESVTKEGESNGSQMDASGKCSSEEGREGCLSQDECRCNPEEGSDSLDG